jgi:putative phosphoesterase
MKLFVLSDIHGFVSGFEAAIAASEREGADFLVIAGDFLNYGPRDTMPDGYAPADLAALLNLHKERIIGVRGNCDSEVDQKLLEFPMMGDYAVVLSGGRRCFVTHGHVFGPDRVPPLSKGDILVSGHTHVPMLEERNGIYLLNPGSVSFPKGGSETGYALISKQGIQLKTFAGTTIKNLDF